MQLNKPFATVDDELRTATAAGEPLLQEVASDGRTVAGTRAWFTTELRASNSR